MNSAAGQLQLAKTIGTDCIGVMIKLAACSEMCPDLASESSWASSRSQVQIISAKANMSEKMAYL